ncbi:nitrous oxide reductase family maturation protein NosD [Micromonospora sp. 067-2]|uniref:right-handed parallel beta-helix repeat-containing protein n=1 Tax=Micromonospora sp. 067-2 TaxID=2789270 RepID=UPI003979427A
MRSARGVGVFALLGAAAAAGLPASAASAAVVPPPPGAIVVGVSGAACPAPAFATITAAVAAAPADSVIYVCAGLYAENVQITKNLTLLGAQFGVDARTGRTNPAEETIVSSPSGEFRYSGTATTGVIDGFTLRGTPSSGDDDGIVAIDNPGAGYTWINNIITGNTTGINFKATGAVPTLISRNRITNNTAAGSSSGNGIFFTNGPANNVTISDNAFAGNSPAINTTGAGDGTTRSQNLTITGNTSVDDVNFVALFLAQHVRITGNTIRWTNPNDTAAGSALYLSGGNNDVTVADNTIDGGAASGINLNNISYSGNPSSAVRITGNTITRRLNGIRVPASTNAGPVATDVTISGNRISDAGVGDTVPGPAAGGNGIWLQGGSQFTVTGNTALTSVSTDCRDETTGGGTAGTANNWTNNTGVTSFPAGLCTRPANPSITGVISATSVTVGGKLSQTVTVTGTGGKPGTLTWRLLGPVPPIHGSCADVDFGAAPVLSSGTVPVTGDGSYTVPTTHVSKAGCYTFTDTLTGPDYTSSASIPPGDPSNTALAVAKILPVTGSHPAIPLTLAFTSAALIAVGVLLRWTTRTRPTLV